jgi:hypothetical protein
MKWRLQSHLVTMVSRGDRSIVLMVGETPSGEWATLIVEGAKGAGEKILDDHAHEKLPESKSLVDAMRLAERYAKWWRGSRASHFKCECETIR